MSERAANRALQASERSMEVSTCTSDEHSDARFHGEYCRVSGPAGGSGQVPLHVWHDERANRAVITSVTETHMAMVVLTRLHLLRLKQVAGGDIEPARDGFH
jgi:hypothetical protein